MFGSSYRRDLSTSHPWRREVLHQTAHQDRRRSRRNPPPSQSDSRSSSWPTAVLDTSDEKNKALNAIGDNYHPTAAAKPPQRAVASNAPAAAAASEVTIPERGGAELSSAAASASSSETATGLGVGPGSS